MTWLVVGSVVVVLVLVIAERRERKTEVEKPAAHEGPEGQSQS